MTTLISQLGVCNYCEKEFDKGLTLIDRDKEYYFCSYECLKKFLEIDLGLK
jgi:ribosomal protein L24E